MQYHKPCIKNDPGAHHATHVFYQQKHKRAGEHMSLWRVLMQSMGHNCTLSSETVGRTYVS